jgi:single-stranded DNA-specific DHH superfamily exonuclease
MDIRAVADDAASLIDSFSQNTMVRVISHYDADGISAAAIICYALLRAGYGFHVTLSKTGPSIFNTLQYEDNPLIIFSDMGSGQLREIEELNCKAVICDHHVPLSTTIKNGIHLNSHLVGFDGGRDACGASMAFALAESLNPENNDLAWLAITGAIGDRQGEHGFKGYNNTILQDAISRGYIEQKKILNLPSGSIQESLESSINPFFVSFSGKKDSSLSLLDRLGIDPHIPVHNLDDTPKNHLLKELQEQLATQGATNSEDLISPVPFSKSQGNLSNLSSILNACGRLKQAGLGLSICLGDDDLLKEGHSIQVTYRHNILTGMLQLEKNGVTQLDTLQYFTLEQDTLGGTLAGLSLKYLPQTNRTKPIFSLSTKEKKIHISGRATYALVQKGMDLAHVLRTAAHAVGGQGGGHPIAAGASIPVGTEETFLKTLDATIRQTFKPETN